MWKEIGKKILEGTLVSVGIKVMADKVVPAAADISKETWKRVKNTKSTGKETESTDSTDSTETTPDKPKVAVKQKPIKTRIVSTTKSKIYDADYQDTEE